MKSSLSTSDKFSQLSHRVLEFNHVRGWHATAHDLAKSVVIEAAELLEHFQWDDSNQRLDTVSKPKDLAKVGSEAADVLCYLISFCHEAGIDLLDALDAKIKHNEEKYPAAMFAGKHNQDFYLKQKLAYRQNRK